MWFGKHLKKLVYNVTVRNLELYKSVISLRHVQEYEVSLKLKTKMYALLCVP